MQQTEKREFLAMKQQKQGIAKCIYETKISHMVTSMAGDELERQGKKPQSM